MARARTRTVTTEPASPGSTRRVAARGGAVLDQGMAVRRPRRRVVTEERAPAVIVEEPVDVVVDPVPVRRDPWSPAQIAALSIGAMFALLGTVGLVRAASAGGGLTGAEVTVAGFHHTGLLGLIELFIGLSLIAVSAVPGGARPVMSGFGLVLAAFGLFVAVDAPNLHPSLAVHGGHAVLYLLSSLVLLMASLAAPLFLPARRRVLTEEAPIQRRVVRDEVVDETVV